MQTLLSQCSERGPHHLCLTFSFPPFSNFSNYKARFSMPGDTEGLWYRWVAFRGKKFIPLLIAWASKRL